MLSAVHAGPEVEADLLGGPCACAAAGAIGLTLDMPHGCDPAMYSGAPARLAPVWEGEQVAESPYQRFMQVRARCAAAAVPSLGAHLQLFLLSPTPELGVGHACLTAFRLLCAHCAMVTLCAHGRAAPAASSAELLGSCWRQTREKACEQVLLMRRN